MAQVGECKFCRKIKELVDSHVIPRALHKDAQGDDEPINIYSTSRSRGKRSPTGVYGRFLCHDCEESVGKDDQYGVEFVRKYKDGCTGEPLEGSFKNGLIAHHVCYTRLKLWVMSMLWRADGCDHEVFKRVDLGEKWRGRLACSLRLRDPGCADYFAVTATLFDEKDDKEDYGRGFMADPHFERYAGVNWYRFYVNGGFTFFVKVDQRKQREWLVPLTLRQGQPFVVQRRPLSKGERRMVARISQPGSPR